VSYTAVSTPFDQTCCLLKILPPELTHSRQPTWVPTSSSVVLASQGGWLWGETQTPNLTPITSKRATALPSRFEWEAHFPRFSFLGHWRMRLEVCHG
jgi:hypothetical protein